MMPPAQSQPQSASAHNSRINLGELKSQLVKKIGAERAKRYFSYLHGLLSHKLSKPDFSKLCLATIGHENLALHNQLICSILRNAYQAKSPPQLDCDKGVPRTGVIALKNCLESEDGFKSWQDPAPPLPIWSNGDILPLSPCKFRDGTWNQKIRDHPSSARQKMDGSSDPYSAIYKGVVSRENGDFDSYDLKRTVQYQQGQPAEQPAKRSRVEKSSSHEQGSAHIKNLVKVIAVEDSEDVEQHSHIDSLRGPLRAPLGIPFCSASIGGARRSKVLGGSVSSSSASDCRELCHTEVLKKRIEHIAEGQGLSGVTMDCANLLNIGLDVYLKLMIKSCVELRGARTDHRSLNQPALESYPYGMSSGVRIKNKIQVQNSGEQLDGTLQAISSSIITIHDFKVAMELNPQQLGEDWPLLLEKVCIRSFEE